MKRKLSWKIIKYILTVYIALGVLITAAQIHFEYESIKIELINSMDEIGTSFVKSLTTSLWDYNLNGLQQTVKGITSYGSIVGAKVISDSGDFAGFGKILEENNQVMVVAIENEVVNKLPTKISANKLIEYKLDLESSEHSDEKLGTLYLYSSRNLIIERIKVGASIIFMKLILQIFILAGVSLLTIMWLVSAPLRKLEEASTKINPTSPDFSLNSNFVKESKLMERSDELGVLAKSLEAARKGLLDRDDKIKDYSQNLEKKVTERTKELKQKNNDIQSILNNIVQGILTFKDDLKIMPQYSSFLEKLFESKNLEGKLFTDLIFKNSNVTENELDQMTAALYSIVNESEIFFKINQHLLVKEYFIKQGLQKKILELEWQPILDDSAKVSKVMLIVKDVTEFRKAKLESENQKKELDMIRQILNTGPKRMSKIIKDQINYLNASEDIIKNNQALSSDDMELLFRNLHTIKGVVRTLDLSNVVDTVHHAEQYYETLKKDSSLVADRKHMLQDTKIVKEGLNVYEQLIEQKFGIQKGVDTDSEFLSEFDRQIDGISMDNDLELLDIFRQILRKREEMRYLSLPVVLAEVVNSLPSIAKNLNKELPEVYIEDKITIRQEKSSLFRDVMTHLFRNSIDHGIELPETRLKKGKKRSGQIHLSSQILGNHAIFEFYDDGAGLNLEALKTMSKAAISLSDEDIAQLIFSPGISTTKELSNISGRGVGMDAVKNFVESEGGKIEIKFTSKNKHGFRSFKYIVTLPMEYFMTLSLDAA